MHCLVRTKPESVVSLTTRLTEKLGIRYPIVNAAMGATAGGALAAAVTAAGGLGLIGAGVSPRGYLEREFKAAGNQRVGCGFITWELEQNPGDLDIAIEHAPAAILLSFGDMRPYIPKIKAAGLTLICQVQTVALAREALHLGADIVVAQGSEAGGHGGSRGTLAFVPAVVDAAASINPEALVVAAGGIADGRGLAAALMLGAEGVLVGTLFHVTTESLAAGESKARVIAGSGDNTVRSNMFDIARDTRWPRQFTLRALTSDFTREWYGRDHELARDEAAKARYKEAFAAQDYRVRQVLAGEGIDQINTIEPAGVVMARIVAQAEAALGRRFG
jgi:nitronate monooxygenase